MLFKISISNFFTFVIETMGLGLVQLRYGRQHKGLTSSPFLWL
jgi:hypothetical protein